MNNLAPIVLFVYARPQHTLKTLEALANNNLAKKSKLYIFADGARENANEDTLARINETRQIIKQKQWCKEVEIRVSETNKGLADSIVDGVSEIINNYGKIIVLEDDIVTSPVFLDYMNEALELYEMNKRVMHIASYMPSTTGRRKLDESFFLRFMSCWGWATWKDSWDKFEENIDYLRTGLPKREDFRDYNLDGAVNMFAQIEANYNKEIKTWAIKWYSSIFVNSGLCLYPRQSMSRNIGVDGSGENCESAVNLYDVELAKHINIERIAIKESRKARNYLKRFYTFGNDSRLIFRIKLRIKKVIEKIK